MTPEELKSELSGMELPKTFRLSAWENITDVRGFIEAQFQRVEQAGYRWERSPAWDRLIRFYEAIKKPGN